MKKRFKVSLVLAAALLACVLVGSVAAGTEEESDLSKAKQIIESHRSVPHVKLSDNEKLQAPDNAKDGVTYSFEYSTSSDGQWDQSKTTASATFYFPADDSHGTKQVLDGEDWAVYAGDDFYLALEASQSGFSSYIIVMGSEAPSSYEIRSELPPGFKLSEMDTGVVYLLDASNDPVGAMAPPWAFDSDGNAVATSYSILDGTLVQTISHGDASYPVVADPAIQFPGSSTIWPSTSSGPNPWGCYGRVENPHESHDDPGPGYIQAKTSVLCAVEPPSDWQALIAQRLYVADDDYEFSLIAAKSSHCQTGAGDPECRNWLRASSYIMRAHVNDQCNPGPTTAMYGQVADVLLIANGSNYTGSGVNTAEDDCYGSGE